MPNVAGSGTWFWQALAAAFLFTPSVLAVGFFKKNFGMDTNIFLFWYFAGTVLSYTTIFWYFGALTFADFVPDTYKLSAAIFGLVFNAAANFLLFKAYAIQPNLAESVVDSKNVLVFVAALVFAYLAPKYFVDVKFHLMHLVGVLCVTAGVIILALKWR